MLIKKAVVYGFGTLSNAEFLPDSSGILNVSKGRLIPDSDLFFEFVRAMLYGHTYRNGVSTRKAYMPEEQFDSAGKQVVYGGELFYDACGRSYRLSRVFGSKPRDDYTSIVDTVSGRDVKIESGRSVGEKTLRITEAAFIAAAKDFGYPPHSNSEGKVTLGRLSVFLGNSDGHPSPKEFKKKLNEKLRSLTNPATKTGALDQLVIKKLNLKNSISRTGERDQKLIKLREDLNGVEEEIAGVDREIKDCERQYDLCFAAKTLLEKDRITALYDQILNLLRQIDILSEEQYKAKHTGLIPSLALPVACVIAGAVLGITGLNSLNGSRLGLPFAIGGGALLIFGAVHAGIALYRYYHRFSLKTEGRITTYYDEIQRLKRELSAKNEELFALLGDSETGDIQEKWRRAEDIMRSAQDSERRYAILKQTRELETALKDFNDRKKPLLEEKESIRKEIESLRAKEGVGFSEALLGLEGIDERIRTMTNEIESVKIAIAAAVAAEKKFKEEIAEPLCKKASEIYLKTSGTPGEFKIDPDYNVIAECGDSVLALLSFRGAVSGFASSESDRQLMFISGEACSKTYLDVFMRASGIAQLVAVNQR